MTGSTRPRRVWVRRRRGRWLVELEFASLFRVPGEDRDEWRVERFERVSSHLRLSPALERAEAIRAAVEERRIVA